MTSLAAAIVLLPLLAAASMLVISNINRQQILSAATSSLCLAISLWLVEQTTQHDAHFELLLGGWPQGVGIRWVFDGLSSIMLALTSLISLLTSLYAQRSLAARLHRHYFPLHQFLVFGVSGCFATGDLFNLFVFFEVMLLTSFALIGLLGEKEHMHAAFPYVTVNLVGSMLFLFAVGIVYGTTGTVDFAILGERLLTGTNDPLVRPAIVILCVVFALKSALFPLFAWLPVSYPHAPLPVAAMFAGLLTKVGVYALFRTAPVFAQTLGVDIGQGILLGVALVTMILGVLGALGRHAMRSILSFHVISQVGFMVLALAIGTPEALAGGIFYIIHHITVKTALFFIAGRIETLTDDKEVTFRARGIASQKPLLSFAFLIVALSLAGLPPFSGFWAKWFIIMPIIEQRAWATMGIALFAGLLTLASMLKIWNGVFWGEQVEGRPNNREPTTSTVAVGTLVAVSILIGFMAGPIHERCLGAAKQVLQDKVSVWQGEDDR